MTLEEKKQQIIVRQNQLGFVLDYLKWINCKLPLDEVVAISYVTSQFCLNGYTASVKDLIKGVDKLIERKVTENE
jgi:hypothetical protein